MILAQVLTSSGEDLGLHSISRAPVRGESLRIRLESGRQVEGTVLKVTHLAQPYVQNIRGIATAMPPSWDPRHESFQAKWWDRTDTTEAIVEIGVDFDTASAKDHSEGAP